MNNVEDVKTMLIFLRISIFYELDTISSLESYNLLAMIIKQSVTAPAYFSIVKIYRGDEVIYFH